MGVVVLLLCTACAAERASGEHGASVAPRDNTPVVTPDPDPAATEAPAAAASETTPSAVADPLAPSPTDAALLALLETYYADFGARNWSAFAQHFWPGATIATIRKLAGAPRESVVVTLVDEYVDEVRALGPGTAPITLKLTARDVRFDGVVAQVLARFDASAQTHGEVHTWQGVDAFTLMLHDGVWRIAALAVGSSTFDD